MNRKTAPYGAFRDFRKINIFVNGVYAGSTTWARSCKQAVEKFNEHHPQLNHEISRVRRITASFDRSY